MTPGASPLGTAERALAVADHLFSAVRDYVVERRIRDRVLASHQAVAHTLADHWVTVEAVRAALVAASADRGDADRSIAVALGATRALLALCDDAVRLRGGRGYLAGDTAAEARLEAMQLTNALGEPDRLAERLGRPTRGSLGADPTTQRQVAEALDGVWDEDRAVRSEIDGTLHDPAVHRAVAARGWIGAFVAHARLVPSMALATAFAIAEGLALAGVPIYALNTTAMAAALIRDHGTVHLRERVLPAMLAGREICALGYTEPEAGSDLAAVRTSAGRDGDAWVLRGTKLFCTLADAADHILVLARSDPEARRHRGLTLFAVPAGLGGIAVTPLPTHGGEITHRVELEDLRALW